MTALRELLRDLAGLFVDDGSLAFALLGWLGISAAISAETEVGEIAKAGVLFGGCAIILVENVLRRARRT